jgi:phosphate transport system substrate-binding protein
MARRSILAAWAAWAFTIGIQPARGEDRLRASGTGTALGAMRRLGEAFEKADPGQRLVVLPSLGSSGALKAVAAGAIDLALAGRPLRPGEQGLGLRSVPYAKTPFVFAVNARAGVTGITAAEAARIYRGEQERWPSGERVRLVLRPRAETDTTTVAAISGEMAAAMEVAQGRSGMLTAATNQDCHEILLHTPGAIGLSSLTQILTEDPSLVPLSWNGVAPTVANLASGQYPLQKTLHLVFRLPPSAAVRRFLAFLASPEAARILEEAGNLPLPIPALD